MSSYLRDLLAAPEPDFSQALHEFEAATGNQSLDISLSVENNQTANLKLRELGLDQNDSTPLEIYHALQSLAKRHDEYLYLASGSPDFNDSAQMILVLESLFGKAEINTEVWAVKAGSMRRLLRQHPPRMVMKRLGYRSAESMIKRENVAELILGARLLESSSWMSRLLKSYKQLNPSDFETRKLQLVAMEIAKWGEDLSKFIASKHINVAHSKEIGAIGIIPIDARSIRPGITLSFYLSALYYLNEIRSYSTYFKLKQVEAGFGDLVARSLSEGPDEAVSVLGRPLHWRLLKRHFGLRGLSRKEVFQPHLQDEDLAWTAAEDVLYKLEPALKFWQGLDSVGIIGKPLPATFNLMDNTISLVNGLEFDQHSVGHFRSSLWNELISRYLAKKQLEDQVIKQLEPADQGIEATLFLEEEGYN
jgi:hypothetical protein